MRLDLGFVFAQISSLGFEYVFGPILPCTPCDSPGIQSSDSGVALRRIQFIILMSA